MRIVIFSLVLIFICPAIAGAGPLSVKDSLLAETRKPQADKKKLFDIYYKLCSITMGQNMDTSIMYGLKAQDVAKKSGLDEQYAKSFLILAAAYLEAGRLEECKEAATAGLSLSEEIGNKTYQYHAHRNLGTVSRRQAHFDSALYHYMACNKVAEQLNDTLLSASYSSLAAYYSTIKQLDKAEEFNLKALELRKKYNDSVDIANTYNNLGILNREWGNYKQALAYYKLAAEIYLASDNQSDIAYIYNDLGAVYSKMGRTDSGGYYLKKSIAIREEINELIELPYTYNYLGENYEREGDIKQAEQYIKKALGLAIQMGNNKQHYEALESLSDFFSRNRMYDSAYAYLQLYKNFRDSIRQLDNERLMEELYARYETELKEKKIQEQEFEIARKNYLLLAGIIIVMAGGLLAYSAYKRSKLKQQATLQAAVMKQQEIATRAVLEAEENERQRIAGDLHDGVGQMMSAAKINLVTIADDIDFTTDAQKQRFENALKLVDDSCSEVRAVSHNIMPNALLRNSLAGAIRNFINRIDQHVIKINLHTEGLNEKLDENMESMLYRVVQESVNNVIKHAGANTLDISLVRDDREVSITIEDNGKGFDTADQKKKEGIGMKNIKSRISFLKGTVEWDSAPGRGTVVSIHVPV